jgi:hypothetical protein
MELFNWIISIKIYEKCEYGLLKYEDRFVKILLKSRKWFLFCLICSSIFNVFEYRILVEKGGSFLKTQTPWCAYSHAAQQHFFFFPGCSPRGLGFHLRTVVRSRPLNRSTILLQARPISPCDGPRYSSCRAVTLATIFFCESSSRRHEPKS